MRDTKNWHTKLTRQLHRHWPEDADLPVVRACSVELGLTLLHDLVPTATADTLWVLLTGYNLDHPDTDGWGSRERQMLATGRHLLVGWKSPHSWDRGIAQYKKLPEHLRLYSIDDEGHIHSRDGIVSIGADRATYYRAILGRPAHYRQEEVQWVTAGSYEFKDGDFRGTVTIPEEIAAIPSQHTLVQHDLTPRPRKLTSVTWADLEETARGMDAQIAEQKRKPENWGKRLGDVRLHLVSETGMDPAAAETLTLEGLQHWVGMVSVGKSTLIEILAVWAAQHGWRTTLVVGDVLAALDRVDRFTRLGLTAAPILGQTDRVRHTTRLHRAEGTGRTPSHAGFNALSTACPLDGLRSSAQPIPPGHQPCTSLQPIQEGDTTEQKPAQPGWCPLYPVCPTHRAQRDLVTAAIWVATPASLVYTRVAAPLVAGSIRFLELAYRRSDLILVDEADQVQVQVDRMFSPSEVLVTRGSSAWLNRLDEQVVQMMNQTGRNPLREEEISSWVNANSTVQAAVDRLYALLLGQHDLREWIGTDYFTGWSLATRLAYTLAKAPRGIHPEIRDQHEAYDFWLTAFEAFLDDPVGDQAPTELADLAVLAVTGPESEMVQSRITRWLMGQKLARTDWPPQIAMQMQAMLLVGVVGKRLDLLQRGWPAVEAALGLERTSALLFNRPPDDWTPLVPEAPMGNILGFQYITTDETGGAGDLRFFRCAGVGRWLLLHLHDMLAAEGVPGPGVILFSGTSWAGTAPSYHVQTPVTGILQGPEDALQCIMKSRFALMPVFLQDNTPVRVSGRYGTARADALATILRTLAGKEREAATSPLIVERDSLPPERRRILLIVGSYEEATAARLVLEQARSQWKGQIRSLTRDDADDSDEGDESTAATLARGRVHTLAATDAWLLIAPLQAIERGHNILNAVGEAALGAVYFLVRPHPRPDDLDPAIHAISHWAIAHIAGVEARAAKTLLAAGRKLRDASLHHWRALLQRPLHYSTLPDRDREALTWDLLVILWQVIGRLVRGGVPARVYFCDAAFAPHMMAGKSQLDRVTESLLVGMQAILAPYYAAAIRPTVSARDQAVVQALYGPLFAALTALIYPVPADSGVKGGSYATV